MVRMWNDKTDLMTMHRNIEAIVVKGARPGVRMGDLIGLSYEDFELWRMKLQGITRTEEIEKYALSIIVDWVVSFRYNKEIDCMNGIHKVQRVLPQHQTKYVVQAFLNVFYEYQLDNYGIVINGLNDLRIIVERHAGIEKNGW